MRRWRGAKGCRKLSTDDGTSAAAELSISFADEVSDPLPKLNVEEALERFVSVLVAAAPKWEE